MFDCLNNRTDDRGLVSLVRSGRRLSRRAAAPRPGRHARICRQQQVANPRSSRAASFGGAEAAWAGPRPDGLEISRAKTQSDSRAMRLRQCGKVGPRSYLAYIRATRGRGPCRPRDDSPPDVRLRPKPSVPGYVIPETHADRLEAPRWASSPVGVAIGPRLDAEAAQQGKAPVGASQVKKNSSTGTK
jgi:hypothetical protein